MINLLMADDAYRITQDKGWRFPLRQTVDEALLPNLSVLQGQSADQVRNDPLAAAAINNMVSGVVGNGGLRPQPQPGAELIGISQEAAHAFARQAESLFTLWANGTCDLADSMCFWEIEQLFFRSVLEFGDVLAVRRNRPGRTWGLALQLVEAPRIDTPVEKSDDYYVRKGVQLSRKTGEVQAFYVRSGHEPFAEKYQRIAKKDSAGALQCIFMANRRRIDATRGEPLLAPVTPLLKQLSRYMQAETQAAVLNSYIAFVTKTKEGYSPLPDSGVVGLDTQKRSEIPAEIKPNTNIHLQENEDIQMLDPKRPNSNFDSFVTSVMRNIGAALEIPSECLLASFTASYSASRASMLRAHQTYRMKRRWLVDNFHQVVWEWFISESVARGYLVAPRFFENECVRRAYLSCEWVSTTPFPQIDPVKEVVAAEKMLSLNLATRKYLTASLTGQNYEQVQAQLIKERENESASTPPR